MDFSLSKRYKKCANKQMKRYLTSVDIREIQIKTIIKIHIISTKDGYKR